MSVKFCSNCGEKVKERIPEGDDRPRKMCDACGMVYYENPKMVVGCIAEWEDKILMCRRAIAPQIGKWTLPAGYLESAETVAAGAMRETEEEARAKVEIIEPFALYNLAFVDQIYFMFRARLLNLDFGPGPESLEVVLMDEAEIPWDNIAFEVIHKVLQRYFQDRSKGEFNFFMGDIRRGLYCKK
ncbi:MAG: NUDIX hydrolase [Desulfobacteraceae bacterium]|jgi:ADP-ribose pyrophosphatase YjhB (NUDIX family)